MNAEEFGRALVSCRPKMFALAMVYLRNSTLAEDALSESTVLALRARDKYVNENFEGWFYRILRNVIATGAKRRKRERAWRDGEAETKLIAKNNPEGEVIALEALAAMARLVPGQRDVAVSILLHERGYEETAKFLGVPVDTVKSRLWRARANLQKTLA